MLVLKCRFSLKDRHQDKLDSTFQSHSMTARDLSAEKAFRGWLCYYVYQKRSQNPTTNDDDDYFYVLKNVSHYSWNIKGGFY